MSSSKSEVLDWLTPERRQSILSRFPLDDIAIRTSGCIGSLIKFSVLEEISSLSRSSEPTSLNEVSGDGHTYSPLGKTLFVSQDDANYHDQVILKALSWAYTKWENRLDSYFLKRKSSLDQVSFRMLRCSSKDFINELYHRVKADEVDFASAASTFGEGPEAKHGGLFPLQTFESIPFGLSSLLLNLELNAVSKPIRIKKAFGIVQLIKIKTTSLDENTSKFLIQELLTFWVSTAVTTLTLELESN